MSATSGRNKKIFISDIHMGDDRSINNGYGWLNQNIAIVANFLDELLKSQEVSEVIILGDLFDQWVIPSDIDPLPTLPPIINSGKNEPIISKLKTVAASSQIKLSYVVGNHDPAFCKDNITDWKKVIQEIFPGINYICNDDLPAGVYQSGKLRAEHGNLYCFFCAPDCWTDLPRFIPLGYFLSRIAASSKIQPTGEPVSYHDLIKKYAPDNLMTVEVDIMNLLREIVNQEKMCFDFKMNGMPGYPSGIINIGGVLEKYDKLVFRWNHPGISLREAFYMDIYGDLSPAFEKIYLPDQDADLVIFGHTHIPVMQKIPGRDGACAKIYANSGTWKDGHTCTYVETELDEEQQRHYVRVKSYPGNQLVKNYEGYVNLE